MNFIDGGFRQIPRGVQDSERAFCSQTEGSYISLNVVVQLSIQCGKYLRALCTVQQHIVSQS